MKNLLYLFLVVFAFSACDRIKPIEPEPNEDIPQAVVQSVKDAFPSATDLKVVVVKNKELYRVDFQDAAKSYKSVVTYQGEIKNLSTNSTTTNLLPSIEAYLNSNYPGCTVDYMVEELDPQTKTTVVGYWVYITHTDNKNYQLYFDQLGGIISVLELGGGNANSNDTKYSVNQSDLPQAILDYLNQQQSGYTFTEGWAVVINNTTTYVLSISNNNVVYYYEFAADGSVLYEYSYDPNSGTNPGSGGSYTYDYLTDASQIPSPITAYLDQQFVGWAFQKGFIEKDENAVVTRYVVLILVGNALYYVEFDANMQCTGASLY